MKDQNSGIRITGCNSALGNMYSFDLPNNSFKIDCDGTICVGATPVCEYRCYGNNARGDNVTNVVKHNYRLTLSDEFVSEMIWEIEKLMAGREETIYFRLHSYGDFYSYGYFMKWLDIIDHFRDRNIVFAVYTKSFGILDKYSRCPEFDSSLFEERFRIMLSIMPDTYYHCKTGEGQYSTTDQMEALVERLKAAYHGRLYVTCYNDQLEPYLKDYPYNRSPDRIIKECSIHKKNGVLCSDCKVCYGNEPVDIIIELLRCGSGRSLIDTDVKKLIKDGYEREAAGIAEDFLKVCVVTKENKGRIDFLKRTLHTLYNKGNCIENDNYR